jgi:hypothetical protein
VLAGVKPDDLSRIILAMRPEGQADLLARLPREQLIDLLRIIPEEQAARLLHSLSTKRALTVMDALQPEENALLLEAMGPQQQAALLAAMDPYRAGTLLTMVYERGIARVLGRTNVRVTAPEGGAANPLMVEIASRFILVTMHHLTQGEFDLPEMQRAEEAARRSRADGVLAVTNARLSREVMEHCREAVQWGGCIDAVNWTDPGHDGVLLRALVALVR